MLVRTKLTVLCLWSGWSETSSTKIALAACEGFNYFGNDDGGGAAAADCAALGGDRSDQQLDDAAPNAPRIRARERHGANAPEWPSYTRAAQNVI